MPDSHYLVKYAGRFASDNPRPISSEWHLQDIDQFPTPDALLTGPVNFAVCSRYEVQFDWRCAGNPYAGWVDFYLVEGAFGFAGEPIGSVFVPFVPEQPPTEDGSTIIPVDFTFNTPMDAGGKTIGAAARDVAYPDFVSWFGPLTDLRLFYLGSSVDCSGIPPPPPLGVWCEPYVPTNADDADALEEIHMERMGVLADTF